MNRRKALAAGAALALAAAAGLSPAAPARAQSLPELEAMADQTMQRLVATQPVTQEMFDRAAGLLIFPEIVKGGLLIGGSTGKGVLRVNGETTGVYRSASVSYGLQAGIQRFGYVMVFMTEGALSYLDDTDGWEVGVGPSVVVADDGMLAGRLSTTTYQDGVYVFFVDQKGYFAGAGIEGTKITRIGE
ncbi:lipid-binding SYLF domain-containing protein [Albimonas sp. CAU 1670]|uniref:lipid-binding SYLF domain-containing protein n=1 Tax=Albimonas sp. CAU 1670 TaxID=3032599 RepID=UPI0023DC8F0F|nr:lipid-binding SYLF domain-containing protein [Albimonas sp. CAU 1670]MDF2233679.1 lipid-binding SYLF domain-containing protein [Albimonas sp. CAU 1670]